MSFVALALAVSAAGCSSDVGQSREGPTITIGSADFSESELLAEIYAQALEVEGYQVERNLNAGRREDYAPALESGELDLVPEYIGSILTFLGGNATSDSEATYRALQQAWADAGIVALDYAPAQDKNGIVVRQDTASELGLEKVSDLVQYNGQLVFGGPPECFARKLCLLGLTDVYGLEFKRFEPLDVGGPRTAAALEVNEIQVALLFTSDGVIPAKGFVLLEDDKGLQPAENIAPVVRLEIVEAYGDVFVDYLNKVSRQLATTELMELNRRIGFDGEEPAEVASDWLQENGFGRLEAQSR